MERRRGLPALLCALAVVLGGCSSMLDREYTSSTVHVEYPVSEEAAVLQADNYQGLVNAILYFVTEHQETGIIHLSDYTGDVGTGLDMACTEVCAEDPLSAYAVEEIGHEYVEMPSYYEVNISIQYAHTAEEVAAIVPAAGSGAMRQTIASAMAAFSDRCVLRVSYFTGDVSSVRQLVRQTLLDTPLAALVQPGVNIRLYPDSGTSRIVEVSLAWPRDTEELARDSALLEQQALALLEGLETAPEELTPEDLLEALRQVVECDPAGGSTAYSALVEGAADDRGVALALRLLCQLADLEATVATGQLDGRDRCWLIVPTPEGYRHLDPSAEGPAYATDDEFREAGYGWARSRYPACTDYTAVGQTGLEIGEDGAEGEAGDGASEEGQDGEEGEAGDGAPEEEQDGTGEGEAGPGENG